MLEVRQRFFDTHHHYTHHLAIIIIITITLVLIFVIILSKIAISSSIALLPLCIYACKLTKLKRASRSHAKKGFLKLAFRCRHPSKIKEIRRPKTPSKSKNRTNSPVVAQHQHNTNTTPTQKSTKNRLESTNNLSKTCQKSDIFQ